MSKKVLNYASRRPMLLALIMVTLTLGLLFSGWLTPTPGKAQSGNGNPPPNNEMVNCVVSSMTTNCTESLVTLSNVTVNPAVTCIGSGVSASTIPILTAGQIIIGTSYTNANPNATNTTCDDSYTTNTSLPTLTSTWTVSGPGSFSASGAGLSASFTPTNCGDGTVTFTSKWTDTCDTNQSSTSVSGSFSVDAVTSLTPSTGLKVDDGDNDPNTDTYLIQLGCYNTITVAAGDCLGLSPSDLPSCWNMTGGTEIDRKNHSVDGHTVGKTVINVTCGTSYKTVTIIVYQAKYEIDSDGGNCTTDVGHAWWNLSVTPSDVYPFLKRADGSSLSGRLGVAGYYGDGSVYCAGNIGCPGQVKFGRQPNSGGGYHTATGSYWWCISFGGLIGALSYVDDLADNPGTYYLLSNNCATEAEEVGGIAGASVGYSGVTPCGLSVYLNFISMVPPTCSCNQ